MLSQVAYHSSIKDMSLPVTILPIFCLGDLPKCWYIDI